MRWNGLPIVIFGSSGISKETYNLIKQINNYNNSNIYNFLGFIEDKEVKIGNEVIDGYKIVACDSNFKDFSKKFAILGIVIPIGTPKIKSIIYDSIKHIKTLVYPNIIHPSVRMENDFVKLGYGNILTSGINLTCDIMIGNFNLINLNSTVGHDTSIGSFNVINPLVSISGNVTIKDNCLIGTGANILQQLEIENNVTVGAGAVVVKNVQENTTVVGIPAKSIK